MPTPPSSCQDRTSQSSLCKGLGAAELKWQVVPTLIFSVTYSKIQPEHKMLAFALTVFLLFPLCSPQLPTAATKQWTIKDGVILDAKGNKVGVYGIDIPRQRLLR